MERINRIKEVLASLGKKQSWLADQIGYDEHTVSTWCRNVKQPKLEVLFKIAEVLDIEARELLVLRKQS
jgi:putative transcriptional regulator